MCRLRSISVTSYGISATHKPRKEWTVRDYKVDAAKEARKMAAFIIKDHGYKEPLTDRQKRVVERIRNGTDFHVFNSMEEIRKRFK